MAFKMTKVNRTLDPDDLFPFGKYTRFTVSEVFAFDPGYIVWFHENVTQLDLPPTLAEKASSMLERYPVLRNKRFDVASIVGQFIQEHEQNFAEQGLTGFVRSSRSANH